MICDVHAHCMPTVAEELIGGHQVQQRRRWGVAKVPLSDSAEDVGDRLSMMDDASVAMQILSLPPLPAWDDAELTVGVYQRSNEALASLARQHPERFRAYADLPLPFLDGALAELERCRTDFGTTAVNILMSSGAVSAVDPRFDPLYAELDRLRMIVFFHPRVAGLCSALVTDYDLTAPMGPILEDTVFVGQIVRRGFLEKFPNLRVVIPHLGGALPIYLERMDNQMRLMFPELNDRPSDVVRRLWFDTVSHGSFPALRSAWESFGVDRLLMGSDFPALLHHEEYRATIGYVRHAGLPVEDVEQILHRNGPALFGLEGSVGSR